MPTIRTGNQEWDQNLNTLGGALFPDPSKAAQGYYYGSQARQSQLESNKIIDQQNYRNRYGMMTQGGAQPGPLTFQQPQNVPGAAPIAAPPANLPFAGAPGAPALSSVMNMTPQQAASAVPAVIQPFTQGTPQPAGPPSAVSPPAPQTTTSNGQVPENDHTSGQLHPASLNLTGVPVQASPAQANGSPAAVPPGMTLPGLMAMHGAGALAGIDAATLAGGGQALAYELFSRKIINENQFKQMLAGTGATQPMVADIGATSAANVANIGAAAELAKQRIATGENARQFNQSLEKTIGPDGRVVYTPRISAAGQTAFDSALAVQQEHLAGAPQQVQPGGPGTPIYTERTDTAIKSRSRVALPTVENTIAAEDAKPGVFTSQDDPTLRIPTTQGRAREAGLVPVPASQDQQNAMLDDAILRTTDPAKRQALIDRKLQLAAIPKGPVDAAEADKQRQGDYRILQEAYPQPDPTTAVDMFVKDPVALKPEAEAAVSTRINELRKTDRNLALNMSAARVEAIRQLQNENVLYKPDEINVMRRQSIRDPRGGDPRIETYTPTGKPSAPHMMVGLKPKPGEAAAPAVTSPISTVVPGPTPARPANQRPSRATPAPAAPAAVSLGASPPGVAEGGTVYGADGQPAGVNRGGQVYAR